MRYACGRVKRGQQPVTDVFRHVEQFALVPRHNVVAMLEIIGEYVRRQQTAEIERMKRSFLSNLLHLYPRTRIFVSNTDTTTSLSKETSRITNFTACSNSSRSPRTTRVSNVSMRVNEKLEHVCTFIKEFTVY